MSWVGWRCQNCRHEFKKNQRFCPQCGYTVYDPIQAEERPDWAEPHEPTAQAATATPTAYQVSCLPIDHAAARHLSVWVKWRGENRWAVTDGGMRCLSRNGEWGFEPQTSSRTDEWIAAHRFDFDTALRLAKEAAPHLTINGLTVADVLEGKFRG